MSKGQTSNRTGETASQGLRLPARRVARFAICVTLVLQVDARGPVTAEQPPEAPSACCSTPTERAERPGGPTDAAPDRIADYAGGIAARLRDADGATVPGHLYLLMAAPGSDAPARLYEESVYTHDRGTHDDTAESNDLAVAAAETITGNDVDAVDFTSAPGGGPSGGLLYLIAYLNLLSDGAFTADVGVAATGQLRAEGYIGHIMSPDEKLGAARLAGADVLFTASTPAPAAIAEHAERHAGHRHRTRHGRVTLADERQLDAFEAWGASRPEGVDVVTVGHIADVAAYLCGATSGYACDVAEQLGATMTSDTITWFDVVRAAPTSDSGPALGHPSVGSLH